MEKFLRIINGYVISLVLLLFGLGFLLKYASGDALESQPTSMLYASLAMIVVGILAMPVVLEKVNQSLYKVLLAVGVLAAAGLAYSVFYSVDEEIQFQATQKQVNATTIQRLKDIRSAQESHLAVNGSFAETFDSLIKFVQAPVVPVESTWVLSMTPSQKPKAVRKVTSSSVNKSRPLRRKMACRSKSCWISSPTI